MRYGVLLAALLLVAASEQDSFTRTVDALTAGVRARATAQRRAGRVLLATGAHPLDGDDLARRWASGATPPYRDRALGPAYRMVTVTPGGAAHFEQTFLAGHQARIAVVPLDRAVFALSVTDDQGTLSCAAPPGGRCSWMPLWTTRYGIDLRNPGRAAGRYYMVIE